MARNLKNNIEIKLEFDYPITDTLFNIMTIDVLKFILYQRHQIPLQYELLEKEMSSDIKSLRPQTDENIDMVCFLLIYLYKKIYHQSAATDEVKDPI